MADEVKTVEVKGTVKDTSPKPSGVSKTANPPEVESNHNTVEPAKPVTTAQVAKMPDYNPMRREGSHANVMSDTSLNADDNANIVDAKGDRPTAAEVEAGKDGNETAAEVKAK